MKLSKYAVILTVFLVAAALPLVAQTKKYSQQQKGTQYGAQLKAASGVTTNATGDASFQLTSDGTAINYTLNVSKLMDVTAAHIHVASAPGQMGDVAVPLYPMGSSSGMKSGSFSGTLTKGSFAEKDFVGPLKGMTFDDLRTAISEGRAYVNVHTKKYPNGEIQGGIKGM
jgi:hypothetical protein